MSPNSGYKLQDVNVAHRGRRSAGARDRSVDREESFSGAKSIHGCLSKDSKRMAGDVRADHRQSRSTTGRGVTTLK